MSLTKVTYSMIESAPANVLDYGAVGDGVADDTAAIQAALSSGSKNIIFPQGKTFIVDGGLTYTGNDALISAYGATIKLKNNATAKKIITLTGDRNTVDGGTWDGNRTNGNSSGSEYFSWAIGLDGDNCTCRNATIKSIYGIGIYGLGNYLLFQNNNITDFIYWGIQVQGGGAIYRGNRAIGNYIDSSAGATTGQGILFTSGYTTGDYQIDWEISGNTIIGPSGAIGAQPINIAVRGKEGIVANNTTRYGSMGFSEGGSGTIVTGNRFFDLQGTFRYGVEPSGSQIISDNYITGAKFGVICSGGCDFQNGQITNNTIYFDFAGVTYQNFSTGSGSNSVVNGNTFIGNAGSTKGLSLKAPCSNMLIANNTITNVETAVFLDDVSGAINMTVANNLFKSCDYGCRAYTGSTVNLSNLYSYANSYISVLDTSWSKVPGVTFTSEVVNANSVVSGSGARLSVVDQTSNILVQYGTGSPEGVVTAGVGSVFYRLDGGAGTTLYVKQTGTGNTGWAGK